MALTTGIDHLIVATRDLPAAAAFCTGILGLHVSGGGTHPAHGTTNKLIVLDEEYIELIGAAPGRQPSGRVGELLNAGDGFAACILSIDDPHAAVTSLRSRGIQTAGPAAGALEAGPQFSRGWSTVALESPTLPGFPFFIKHDSTGEERRRLLAGATGLAPHAIGASHVATVTVAVRDLAASGELFARTLDIDPGQVDEDAMLAARCLRLELPSGATIVLAAPLHPESGPIAMALARRGEGAFAFTLAVSDLAGAVRTLRGHGIGVRVDEPEGILVAAQLNHQNTLSARIGLVQA